MLKNKLRLLGMSALVGAGLLASGPASAYNMKLGSVDVQVDTTLSAGMSIRTANRDATLLPTVSGGPNGTMVTTKFVAGVGTELTTTGRLDLMGGIEQQGCGDNLAVCETASPSVDTGGYAGSINTDDGRLNFDRGDLTSGIVKATVDVQASVGNVRAFARVSGFYDAVLDNENSYERRGMTSTGYNDGVRHIDLLDAYVDYESSFMGNPFLIRAGKQVINWGESTFVLGGNSVFSPINVAAIQRPGAEIKEALLPVEAIYGSISLPYDLSLEAYVGGHDPFEFAPAGTSLSNVDGFFTGGIGGSFIGGNRSSGNGRINCDRETSSDYTIALGAAYETALAAAGKSNCTSGPGQNFADFRYGLGTTEGITSEEERLAGGDPYFLKRNTSLDTDTDFDSVGIALRWYAENLNSTEFGFYYQDYASRIPYVSIFAKGPSTGIGTIGPGSSSNDRGAPMRGQCAAALPTKALLTHSVTDATGITDATSELGQELNDLHGLGGSAMTLAGIDVLTGGALGLAAMDADVNGLEDGYISAPNTYGRSFELACYSFLSAGTGSGMTPALAAGYAGEPVLGTGEMVVGLGWGYSDLVAEYPDVEAWGFSAATTLLGWGVQGEITYRPEMPLQIDTDSLTISTLVANCGFDGYGGFATSAAFQSYAEFADTALFNNKTHGVSCGDTGLISGYHREDVINWDIGTTATFTRSNPVINFLGADLGILLTEFAGVHVEDIDDENGRFDKGKGIVSANICTSGSDLALKGVFSLDPRGASECRATRSSYGGVLLARLQYNNAFGSALSISPTFVVQHGIEGRSPSPAGQWREGIGRAGLSVDIDYQGQWTTSVGYTDYYGDNTYSRNGDMDFVSLSVKRGF
ncbi:DUF1302 domain-containing protein [Alphaproteobacteria bacterium]|nr:DUF1302 domain-containing protein [Alphaproteobacteria bacterium]